MLSAFDFKEIAKSYIQCFTLSPEQSDDKKEAVEFVFYIDEVEYIIRAVAWSGTRQIWLKREIWTKVSDNEADWVEGLNLFDYTGYGKERIRLQEIRIGVVDTDFDPIIDRVFDFSGCKSKFEIYVVALKNIFRPGDTLSVSFQTFHLEQLRYITKEIDVKDGKLQISWRKVLRNPPQFEFSAEGLLKILKNEDFTLQIIRHERDGTRFT